MPLVAKSRNWLSKKSLALAILAILTGIAGRLLAQEASRSSDAKTRREDSTHSGMTAAATTKPAEPQIVIADHVILWDNRIMSWNEVVERLRLLRRDGPIHPEFKMT